MRIVILTTENLFSNLITERLLKELRGQVVGIVRSDCLVHGKSLIQALLYLVRRTGLHFTATRATKRFHIKLLSLVLQLSGRQPKINSLRAMQEIYRVPVVGSRDVNGHDTMSLIRSLQPELLVSVHLNQRIKKHLISLPGRGIINIHPSLLPRYRGAAPIFMVLANGEIQTGVTVHWVDEGFDTGPVIVQEKISIKPDDTILSLTMRASESSAKILVKAVGLLSEGNPPCFPQDNTQASYYSLPTRSDQRRFRQMKRRYGSVFALLKYLT